ncbi:class I SAM-dependent methyltransferase [Photobacterium damselae]|uniref:class I SAM-dependent methyltransferase n=1 Tax=Photobacterium damselae TaxID=38293 RepID=UPI0035A8604B
MRTYKQEIKEKSRVELWTRSIEKLTSLRSENRILKEDYIKNLWDHAFNDVLKNIYANPDQKFLKSWCDYAESSYLDKRPENLKIAYFCGPEPENDLEIMLNLGVRIENVWAIEADKEMYSSALKSARKQYPTLKVFHGTISELMKVTPMKFDIIYLDFTGPLFSKSSKPLLTVNTVFETQSLSDLGVLIVNSALPDQDDESVKFLSGYFQSQPFVEKPIFTGTMSDTGYYEGADSWGYGDPEYFEELIANNFECAYSAFSTHYPSMFGSYIQPMYRVANSDTLKKMFFGKESLIKKSIEKMSTIDTSELYDEDTSETSECLGDEYKHFLNDTDFVLGKPVDMTNFDFKADYSGSELYEAHEEFPIWHFINSLKDSKTALGDYWYQQISRKNGANSYFDAVKLYDLLRNANYSYRDTLSKSLADSITNITDAIPDKNGGVFCDVPMDHLWVELALNQLGSTYHMNSDAHWRSVYTAKTRTMYLDMFVFDRCRALYDWIPMLNLYGEDLVSIERQIIIRSCMDAITKQNHHSAYFSYYGANLIGDHEQPWASFGKLICREEITV